MDNNNKRHGVRDMAANGKENEKKNFAKQHQQQNQSANSIVHKIRISLYRCTLLAIPRDMENPNRTKC